jgi:hypothetical protein
MSGEAGRWRAAAGPLFLVAVGAAMLAWTWRGWSDPLVDFGRELYVPWRLSEGDGLYTDVAWFNGPLSQYGNAMLFRVFGPGLMVLAMGNAIVLGVTVGALYRLVADAADRATATLSGVIFLLVFGFGQYVGIANYNWITPYSHELTHGVALALVALVALGRWSRTGSRRALLAGGFALGLCFLTKPETFLAGAAGCLVVVFFAPPRAGSRSLPLWFASVALPPLTALLLLGPAGALGAWPSVLQGDVSALSFYREGMGLDVPAERIAELLGWISMWTLALFVPLSAAWLARGTRSPALPAAAAAGVLTLVFAARGLVPWADALRPLPVATAAVIGFLALEAWREPERRDRSVRSLALGVFALVLLGKMLLNARVQHYGFVLAAPAVVFVVVALLRWLPDALDVRGLRGAMVRASVLAFLAVFAFEHVRMTGVWLGRKTEVVGEGRDAFRADLRGAFVNLAVERVRTSGAGTLAVLPEGVMINYLARVPNPTPYLNFMPPEALLFGDAAWKGAFEANPPDLIVIVPKDVSEYGMGQFGSGYGRELAAWVSAGYERSAVLRLEGVGYEVAVLSPRGPGN